MVELEKKSVNPIALNRKEFTSEGLQVAGNFSLERNTHAGVGLGTSSTTNSEPATLSNMDEVFAATYTALTSIDSLSLAKISMRNSDPSVLNTYSNMLYQTHPNFDPSNLVADIYYPARGYPVVNSIKSHYDYILLDDTSNFDGNARVNTTVGPLRITVAPLNMFVLDYKKDLNDFFYTLK